MQFLLEGADGTGKTTLAGALQQKYSAKYLHFSVPDSHPIAYWMEHGLSEYPGGSNNVVIDRLHLSEEAYGEVYRGGSGLSSHEFWLLEGWLWARNTVLVLCHADWGDMQANQAKAESQIYHNEQQMDVASQFALLAHKTSLPLVFYNYKRDNFVLPPTARVGIGKEWYVKDWSIEDSLGLTDRVCYDDDGIGSLNPKVWLVGDQPNPKFDAPITDLFQPAFQSSSGGYLQRALEGQLSWNDMHLSNSRDRYGVDWPLQRKWAALGNPSIIALGIKAHKALTAAELYHDMVPHPQWWRRFRHADVEEYGRSIVSKITAR